MAGLVGLEVHVFRLVVLTGFWAIRQIELPRVLPGGQ
jgi:hypothetical protein